VNAPPRPPMLGGACRESVDTSSPAVGQVPGEPASATAGTPEHWGAGGGHPASAYDALAPAYDAQVQGDAWIRQQLWESYARNFRRGQHILDVSCGTGIDAGFLARRGIRVTGIDISPGMIAQMEAKVAALGLASLVEARVLDFANLGMLPPDGYDGIISAFAGLNTAPDLAPFAADAARLLQPGGRMVVHLLARFSLWEWLGHIARRDWAAARDLRRQRERTFVIGGEPVPHYPWLPQEAYRRFFAPHFRLQRAYSCGALRPPHTLRRVPAPVVGALEELDRRLGGYWPFVNGGRSFVLELVRRGRAGG
jgi:SAM-dependent methyltransferase